MIDKIIKIFQIIQAQIIFDNLLTRFICIAFMILFIVYYLNRAKKQSFSVYDYRLNWWGDLLRIAFLYVILYWGLIFYLRLSKIGSTLNLKIIYNNIKDFITTGTILDILITILFWSLFFCIFLIILISLKKLIEINLFKIHFFIISKYPMRTAKKTPYEYLQNICLKCYSSLSRIFYRMAAISRKTLYTNFLNLPYYEYKQYPFETFLSSISRFNALIILLLLIVYDIIANDFLITKAYYFMPFVIFYSLLHFSLKVFFTYELLDAQIIACFLYIKEIEFTEDYTVYENGVIVRHEDLYNLFVEIRNKNVSINKRD